LRLGWGVRSTGRRLLVGVGSVGGRYGDGEVCCGGSCGLEGRGRWGGKVSGVPVRWRLGGSTRRGRVSRLRRRGGGREAVRGGEFEVVFDGGVELTQFVAVHQSLSVGRRGG
jgi:hypothetical protein